MNPSVFACLGCYLFLAPILSHAAWQPLYSAGKINYEIDLSTKTVLDASKKLISIQVRTALLNKEIAIKTYLMSCQNHQYQTLHVKKPTDHVQADLNFSAQPLVLKLKTFDPKKNILLSKIRTETCKARPPVQGKIKAIVAK